MTLKHLEIYRTVCRNGTMTGAARVLHMTQPAVSRAIAELEDYYGKRLFDRIGRQLLLTPVGKQLLADAEGVLNAFDSLERHIGLKQPVPVLKVGCSFGIGFGCMDRYLEAFARVCPDTAVHVTENATSVLQTYLLSGELDFAIVEGFITDDSLLSTAFFDDELLLLASPACPLADGHRITPAELMDQAMLLPDRMTGTRAIFDSVMATAGISIAPVWSGMNMASLIRMAREGRGITVVSRHWVEEDLSEGTLIALPAEFSMRRSYSLVYHRSRNLPREAFTFMELCRKLMQKPADQPPYGS